MTQLTSPTNEPELDEVLRNLYNIGRHEESGGSTDRELAFNEAKQAILDWHNKQVEELLDELEALPHEYTRSVSVKRLRDFIAAKRTGDNT